MNFHDSFTLYLEHNQYPMLKTSIGAIILPWGGGLSCKKVEDACQKKETSLGVAQALFDP